VSRMVAAEMVLIGDVLQGSRTRAATAARVGGVTGGEDMNTKQVCGGMERKVVGPPVDAPGDVRMTRRVRGAGIWE
jgi:hypothetical protein